MFLVLWIGKCESAYFGEDFLHLGENQGGVRRILRAQYLTKVTKFVSTAEQFWVRVPTMHFKISMRNLGNYKGPQYPAAKR
jgi:hypothetical protein